MVQLLSTCAATELALPQAARPRDRTLSPLSLHALEASRLCGALLWNLEATQEGQVQLAFTRADWPAPLQETGSLLPLLWAAVPLVLVATYILAGFVGWHF